MKSKSRHKFNHWDNKALFQSYEQALQIQTKLHEKLMEGVDPLDLPQSIIPTNIIYDIAACYTAMYEKLLHYELLEAGYPKSTNTYH